MKKIITSQELSNENLDFYGLSYKCDLNDRESIMVFLTMQLISFPEELEQRGNYLPYEIFKRAISGEIECLTNEDINKLKTFPSIFMQICNKCSSVSFYGVDIKHNPKYMNSHRNRTKEEIVEYEIEKARKDAITAKGAETRRLNKLKKEQENKNQ